MYKSIILILSILLFSISNAEVPSVINYQGRLTNNSGEPLDTTVQMVFTIYDESTGGNTKWTETNPVVTVSEGLFNVLLGSVNPIIDTVFNSPNRYLGITIGSNPEISPRSRLISVSYAYRVGTVDGATGGTINGDISIEGEVIITGETIYVNEIQIEETIRHYSIPPASFMAGYTAEMDLYNNQSGSDFENYINVNSKTINVWPFVNAPIQLPQGSEISKIVLYYYMTNNPANSIQLSFYRNAFSERYGVELLGETYGGGPPDNRYDSLAITNITQPEIDNHNYNYYLELYSESNFDLHIHGVRIEYTIETPLP